MRIAKKKRKTNRHFEHTSKPRHYSLSPAAQQHNRNDIVTLGYYSNKKKNKYIRFRSTGNAFVSLCLELFIVIVSGSNSATNINT